MLAGAVPSGGLAEARDPAAVLASRLDPGGHDAAGRASASTGPLPWLSAVPAALGADPEWGSYLADRAVLVAGLRDTVTAQARAWTPTSAPAWAAPLVDRDSALAGNLAVWRAAHAIEDADRRPTGAAQPAIGDAREQRALEVRVTRLLGDEHAASSRWAPLADSTEPRLTADPYWPTLADRLSAVDRAGIDITALTQAVGADGPLPDEQPAAALWWRLAGRLSPAAMTATDHSDPGSLRPAWTHVLADIVGEQAAGRVLADPAWPALVAAVTHAGRGGWEPETVLSMAYDLLQGGQPDDQPLRPDELATALGWRIRLLPDQASTALPDSDAATEMGSRPAEPPADDRATPPADLDRLPGSDDIPDPDDDPGTRPPAAEPRADEHAVGGLGAEPDGPIGGTLAALERADQQRPDHAADRTRFPAVAAVPRARMVELNALAEAFFTGHYPGSWAADYLRERTGTDPTGTDPRFTVGYAPAGWTALTRYLRSVGVTDTEIVGAGLGVRASAGTVIDRFRDRLIFPIKAADPDRPGRLETRGFIARRNPAHSDDDRAGPKYLNTPDTDLFTKGHELYGLAEHAAALTAGATPVLVEGPLDAIAITLAGEGRYVGVAPLGTAFTNTQADALRPHLSTRQHGAGGPGRTPIIVATDNDRAGRHAAHRAFWQLTARGEDPRQLHLPPGTDPAELLQTGGPAVLLASLEGAPPLAGQIIADRTAALTDRLDTIEGRVEATRRAADVLGALPPGRWLKGATNLAAQFGVAAQTAINEVLDAGHAWTEDPHGRASQRLSERVPEPAPTPVAPSAEPTARWAALVTDLAGSDVTADSHWPVLAEHLSRAQATGYNVDSRLRVLLAGRPLPAEHALRNLDLRLIGDCPGALPPPDPTAVRDNQTQYERAAGRRMAIADQNTAREQVHTTRGSAVRAARRDPDPPRVPAPPPDPASPRPGSSTRRL